MIYSMCQCAEGPQSLQMSEEKAMLRTLLLLCLLSLPLANAGANTTYVLTDLGPGTARGINHQGQVVGDSGGQAFLWTPDSPNGRTGTSRILGTLSGDSSGCAYGINNHGEVVGTSGNSTSDHAVLWGPNAAVLALGNLIDRPSSYAVSINDAGQIVGHCSPQKDPNSGNWQCAAFVWTSSAGMRELVPLDSPTLRESLTPATACAINSDGVVVGATYAWAYDPSGYGGLVRVARPCYWIGGGAPQSLGIPANASDPHSSFSVIGVSDSGQMLCKFHGTYPNAYGRTGDYVCLWSSTMGPQFLDAVGHYVTAASLGPNGEVVGSTAFAAPGAFLYADGNVIDLSSLLPAGSGWALYGASAINDRGQIVGWGWGGSSPRAFLLSPVPEPSCLAVILGGLCAAGLALRKRR
jgi:probable HAF family extracellular repeat protein